MVSTDMTLNISSVPTSVITNNTSTSVTVKGDQGIDNILQYFRCQNQTLATDNTQRNLPLDLSVRKVVEGSTLLPNNMGFRKRKRNDIPLNENGNLLYVGKRQTVALQNKAATPSFEEKKPERKAKVEKVKEHDTEITMQRNHELDDNPVENKMENEKASKRQKKIQKSDKKKQAPLANPGKLKTDVKNCPKYVPHIEDYDTKPKDMPLIVEDDYFTTNSAETKDQNEITE